MAARLSSACSLFTAAFAALVSMLPTAAGAACRVESLDMPVKMVGSRAVATVGINGTPVPLTVDSGAFFSFLTDAAAAELQLPLRPTYGLRVDGVVGQVETRMTTVEKLHLLTGDIPKVQFIVGGNDPGAGTMGLMGRNMLSFTDTEYDLANGMIRFLLPDEGCAGSNMAYWAGSSPVIEVELLPQARVATPPIRARVKLNGVSLVALFDTGATTLVSVRAARRAGIADADMTPSGTIYGAGRGRARMWTALFDRFELGSEAISNNRLGIAEMTVADVDMLLGIDFFLSHRIYVSKSQSKLFATYNGGSVFALNKSETASAAASEAAGDAAAASADTFARRGAASAARGQYERALADLDRACEIEPTSAAYLSQRGIVQEALNRPVAARLDFDKALALDAGQTDARLRRAVLRLRARDRDGAKSDLDALDGTLASQSQARLSMSRLYQEIGEPGQALAQLNHWLPAHPNELGREGALHSRCWARVMLGVDLDKALDDCDQAVDHDARNGAFRGSRAWVHLRMGRLPKALDDFDRSLAVLPNNPWSLYGRGVTQTRLGEVAKGEADLAAARRAWPDIDRQVTSTGLLGEAMPK